VKKIESIHLKRSQQWRKSIIIENGENSRRKIGVNGVKTSAVASAESENGVEMA